MPLLITFLAGISIIAGAAITKIVHSADRVRQISFALALGALMSLLLFDLLPEVKEATAHLGLPLSLLLIAIGIAVLRGFDHFIPDHKDTETTHDHGNSVHIGFISSLAIILHNIIEGMTVYSLSLASIRQGAVFALGIALHNIPMGMLVYSAMAERKRSTRRTMLTIVTCSTLFGGLLMYLLSDMLTETLIGALICIASGMILYIVLLELLPHVIRTRPVLLSILISLCGFLLVYISFTVTE